MQGCLTSGHYVHTKKGFIDIQQLCNALEIPGTFHEHRVHVLNKNGTLETSSHNYTNGTQPTKSVSLSNGSIIRGTHNHQFMTNPMVWKRIDELQSKVDSIMRIRGLNRWAEPEVADELLNRFEDSPVKSISPELASFLGLLYAKDFDSARWGELTRLLLGVSITREQILEHTRFSYWLVSLGVKEGLVPDIVLCSPSLCVRAFLKASHIEDGSTFYFQTDSRLGAEQYSMLLNNFGVRTLITEEPTSLYHIKVEPHDYSKFLADEEIPVSVDRIIVSSIQDSDPCPTYDITTELTHSYLANGYITHNSNK